MKCWARSDFGACVHLRACESEGACIEKPALQQLVDQAQADGIYTAADQETCVNPQPFVDTPVLRAKRVAFDNPTEANLEALIAAVSRQPQADEPSVKQLQDLNARLQMKMSMNADEALAERSRLKSRIAWLEGTALPHARKQEHANGFQAGWRAALQRLREGDKIHDLAELVPLLRQPQEDDRPMPVEIEQAKAYVLLLMEPTAAAVNSVEHKNHAVDALIAAVSRQPQEPRTCATCVHCRWKADRSRMCAHDSEANPMHWQETSDNFGCVYHTPESEA